MPRCKRCQASGPNIELVNKCLECEEKVFINELLHYVTFQLSASCRDNIQKVIEETFNHQEIKDAKKLLSDLGVKVEKENDRRESPNMAAEEADLADLMDAIEVLYKMPNLNPQFTAWSDVSKFSPKEAENPVSLAERLSRAEVLLKKV